MRICIIYDCLYPWTVGGAERWYRSLAEELARGGQEVTYLTRRQWTPEAEPRIEGIRVIAVSGSGPLYGPDGHRLIGPPLRFGAGVLGHLARHRQAYDVVHVCAFPYFSLLAARMALVGTRIVIGVDWFEVWTRAYWLAYLGPLRGRIGHAVQRLCARVTPMAFVFSQLHARRLKEEGLKHEPIHLAGLYMAARAPEPGLGEPAAGREEPLVVFAGRHIPEKRAPAVVPAVAWARRQLPQLRGLILGDGPEHARVTRAIVESGLVETIAAPGFVDGDALRGALADALCLLLPSEREGYGLVVMEAAALGTPSVVAPGPDNAATELIVDGVNGFVAASPDPEALGEALVRVFESGERLRASTRDWFERRGAQMTAAASAALVLERYRAESARS